MRQAPMPRASSVSAVPEGRPHIRDNATPRRNENCHDTNGSKSNPAYVDLGSPCPGFASGDSATVVERCRHHLSTSSMRHHGYPKCPETRSLPWPGETSRPHFGSPSTFYQRAIGRRGNLFIPPSVRFTET